MQLWRDGGGGRARRRAGAALLALALLLPAAAAAQTFLLCRFEGARLRLVLEGHGLALELPGLALWQEAEMISARDPLIGGFAGHLPGEGWRRLPEHDRFTLSLDRQSGAARLTLAARPPEEEVRRCRAAIAAAAPVPAEGEEPPPASLPPPCDLPVSVGVVSGVCEVQRVRF